MCYTLLYIKLYQLQFQTFNLSWALQYEWPRGLGLVGERFGSVCITAPFLI